MTYDEIRRDVARLLALPVLEDDSYIMAQFHLAARRANNDIALALRVPTVTDAVVPSPTGIIAWPGIAFGGREAIIYVLHTRDEHTRSLPIMSLEEAYIRFPQWEHEQGEDPERVVYDPGSRAAGIRLSPYSITTPGTFRLRFVRMPLVMDSPHDQPLSGELPQYHDLVSLKTAIFLLEYDFTGGEVEGQSSYTNMKKLQLLNQQLQFRLAEALKFTRPSAVPVRNPLWSV